jgi:arsenate reductase
MPQAEQLLKVLFLCTGNSCRSQMAEGWARHLKRGVIEPYSAGLIASGLHPLAVRVMAESGVDISRQRSEFIDDYLERDFDYVVTVCSHAHDTCPRFPGNATVVHRGFDDPPSLTMGMHDEAQVLAVYRRVRDEIRQFIETLPEALHDYDRGARHHG